MTKTKNIMSYWYDVFNKESDLFVNKIVYKI